MQRKSWVVAVSLLLLAFALIASQQYAPAPAPAAEQHFGYTPQPELTRQFVAGLPTPTLAHADPNLFRAAPVDTFLYQSLQRAHLAVYGTPWVSHAQGIGDCVSWGWAHGADVHLAVLWEHGATDDFKVAATEAIYGGSRVEANGGRLAGYGDGSYGAAAAKWVRGEVGGILFREKYGDLDLSIYSASRAKNWGNYGCGGKDDDGRLDAIAKLHPIKDVTLVRNFDEAAAAIQSGYPVPVCSGQGFASSRDNEGFAAPRGSWAHCMCFTAVRYGARPGLLCQNSWGPDWIEGPKWPADQPDGSFWVDAHVATAMLRGGDSFAVSGYEGFPFRDLKHGDWVKVDLRKGPAFASEDSYVLAP